MEAPDVYWNAIFKARIRQRYEQWMMSGVKSFTAAGNMRAPEEEVYLSWILDAWNDIDTDLIVRSFKGNEVSRRKVLHL